MFKSKWMSFLVCVIVLWLTWFSYDMKYDELNKEFTTTQLSLQAETNKVAELKQELAEANNTIENLKNSEYELVYMGEFKITHYCDERTNHICGGSGITASGKPTEVGWTAAADWGVLPNGSVIYISGIGFREIQDVGGSVNGSHIDILVEKHSDAIALGVKRRDVWILIKKS